MEKKRKWEKNYEKYSTLNELDERLEYLQDLINGKVATKEEYDENKKLTNIKANLPKVKNILELRGKLEGQRKEINEEITRRELLGKYDKAIIILEDEMKKLEEEKTYLEQEMKANPDKKAELQIKLAENEKKRQENNVKFGNAHEKLKEENKKTEKSKFKDISLEELKNEAISISSNISQCNLACNKLMQGYSWQSIEVALDKFKGEKLTAKGQQAAKIKQNREAAKVANTKAQQVQVEQPVEVEPESKLQSQPQSQEENALANLTMWQKAKNWTKNLWGQLKEKLNKDKGIGQEEAEAPVENEGNKEKASLWQKLKTSLKVMNGMRQSEIEIQTQNVLEENIPSKQEEPVRKEDAFRQYLRDVAEKGMDAIEQEKADAEKVAKDAKREAAKQKLEANRAAAKQREAERDKRNNEAR